MLYPGSIERTSAAERHERKGYMIVEVDPDGSYLGEIKFGFLSNVDGTNGDFNQLADGKFHILLQRPLRSHNEDGVDFF